MQRTLTVKRILFLLATGVVAALLLAFIAREPGTSHAEQARAEEKAVLLSLEIQGPSSVNARSAERFTLAARYSDGTVADVTDRAEWSIDSPYAALAGGVLAVRDLPADQVATVTAWFTEGLSFKAARTVGLSASEPRTEKLQGPTARGST
ncbi:MAG: hypothetical protein AB1578_07395 [Thermodesulfobacteriota bacterium]